MNLPISNDMVLAAILGLIGTITILFLLYNKGDASSKYRRRGKEVSKLLEEEFWIESPMIRSEWLSDHIGNNCVVNLKLDCLQPSGSFKIRGISAFMKKMYELNSRIDTFITTSSANAGMATAYVANKLNCKCIVVLDESQRDNSLLSVLSDTYHAEIKFEGATWNDADDYAVKLGQHESGKFCYVPMFDDASIFNGHSSVIREVYETYLDGEGGGKDNYPDCIVVSVGGGGLLTGVLGGLFQVGWSRTCKIIAAQSENSALFANAVNNSYQPLPTKCVSADGVDLGHRAVCRKVLELSEKYNHFNPVKSMIVKDLDVLNISTMIALKEHILVEPLCAVAITAVFKNRQYFKQFNNICIIVCGGNHIYFNPKLLQQSIDEDLFNHKTASFDIAQKSKPIKQIIKEMAIDPTESDEKKEDSDDYELNAVTNEDFEDDDEVDPVYEDDW